MKIATWNVNSVRMRIGHICRWLEKAQPDVLLLQELKCETEAFPYFEIQAAGYRACVLGQKSYNGVALLSRHPVEDIKLNLYAEDQQARYVEATVKNTRIASLYLPNGNPVGTDKYDYKMKWMKALKGHLQKLLQHEYAAVLGGDFNVIPTEMDVFDPKLWTNDALFLPETRKKWREMLNLGYVEAFRALHPDKKDAYSFWDYQAGSWPQNKGLRIDHFLLSPQAADRLIDCQIDPQPRGEGKASDHTPVWVTLKD